MNDEQVFSLDDLIMVEAVMSSTEFDVEMVILAEKIVTTVANAGTFTLSDDIDYSVLGKVLSMGLREGVSSKINSHHQDIMDNPKK